MNFFTKVLIPKADFSVKHTDGMMLMGSCFTENIGQYLQQFQFNVNINPFGIIYNPISLFNNLNNILQHKKYTEQDLLFHNELYLSLDHHGSFSNTKSEIVLENINESIEKAHDDFNKSQYLIFTLGTAFTYTHQIQNRVVANCHKIPNNAFNKAILSVEEIKNAYKLIHNHLNNKTILFTVSPVRHWRDGAIENQRSKSILIESIHQIIAENKNCHYFPGYEIMMDELRDYRFYEEDMLHPNKVAVKYIWQRFSETYFDENTIYLNHRIQKIQHLLQHRIKHTDTNEHHDFKIRIQKSNDEFKNDYPNLVVNF